LFLLVFIKFNVVTDTQMNIYRIKVDIIKIILDVPIKTQLNQLLSITVVLFSLLFKVFKKSIRQHFFISVKIE